MKTNLCWDQQFSYLRLKGSGARSFLHGQTTANVLEKKDGEIFLTLWLILATPNFILITIKIGLIDNEITIIDRL